MRLRQCTDTACAQAMEGQLYFGLQGCLWLCFGAVYMCSLRMQQEIPW